MLKEISYTRFRGHEAKYALGPGRNMIKGPNEAGKSTVKEAIAFAWMGTDAAGSKNPDHLITVGQDNTEVRLTTPKSTIARRKKRGATSEIKIVREGIPDVKISQSDLMGQIGISQEVFMSSWVVGYFMSLKGDAKLKVLGEIAKIDRKSLLATIVDISSVPAQVKFINPRIDADAVAGIRRAEQNKKTSIEGAQAAVLQQLHNMPQAAVELDAAAHTALIADLDALIQEHNLYKQNLPRWKAENDKRSGVAAEIAKLKLELSACAEKVNTARAAMDKVAAERDDVMAKGKELTVKIDNLYKTKKQVEMMIPPKPNVKAGTCPTCMSVVGEDQVANLMKPYEEAVEKYNKHSRQVADFNKKIDDEALELQKKVDLTRGIFQKLISEHATLSAEFVSESKNYDRINAAIEANKKIPTDILPPPQAPIGVEAELMTQRDNAKQQLHEFNLFNTQRAKLQAELKTNADLIQKHSAEVVRLTSIEEALRQLPELETKATLETVKIPGINMALIDGDLVVTNEEGVDYRCLSDGRRMKVDMGICLAIKRAEPRSPDWLFVDNADLMDEQVYPPEGVQVLIAHVDPTLKGVQVVQL